MYFSHLEWTCRNGLLRKAASDIQSVKMAPSCYRLRNSLSNYGSKGSKSQLQELHKYLVVIVSIPHFNPPETVKIRKELKKTRLYGWKLNWLWQDCVVGKQCQAFEREILQVGCIGVNSLLNMNFLSVVDGCILQLAQVRPKIPHIPTSLLNLMLRMDCLPLFYSYPSFEWCKPPKY